MTIIKSYFFLDYCRDPSLRATWRASYSDTWHALSSGSSSSGPSHKAHMARFSGLPQERSNDAYKHIIRTAYTNTFGWSTYSIRIQWSGSLTKVKRVSHASATTSHGPCPITCRMKRQVEVTTSHFPRSFYMITSHDLWQQHHLPRFLTAASRVVMTMLPPNVIMTNIKYLLAINERNNTPGTIYEPSHEKEGNLQRPRKRPTDLYFPL